MLQLYAVEISFATLLKFSAHEINIDRGKLAKPQPGRSVLFSCCYLGYKLKCKLFGFVCLGVEGILLIFGIGENLRKFFATSRSHF